MGSFFRVVGGSERAALSQQRRWGYLGIAVADRLIPKIRSKVALHSTIDVEDGILAVLDELVSRGWRPIMLLEDQRRRAVLQALTGRRVLAVPKWSLRGVLHFLTARYVMTTGDVYGGFGPPAAQILVNLWHGEPPTKVTGRFGAPGGLHVTFAPVCSTLGRAYRAAEFDLHPQQVPIVGAPRNDRLLRADRTAMRQLLLQDDADRTVFLWMPSYRVGSIADRPRRDVAAGHSGVSFSLEELRRLDDWLVAHDARLVVKLHHLDSVEFPRDFRAIRVLVQGDLEQLGLTLYPALSAFDALITDMSSVWVDYLLVDKPMIFAFPDVESYRRGRGLNLEPYEHWVPGPFARSMDEVLAAMTDVVDGRDPMAEERRLARLRFHRWHDDGSTTRLLDGLGMGPR
jgi:CDP-glycerol glycerophosphotransferase (TagB/SpsB family)